MKFKLDENLSPQSGVSIRPLTAADELWVTNFIKEHWGAEIVVAHGTLFHAADLPGFVAEDGKVAGLVTYHIEGDTCEIVTLDSLATARASARRSSRRSRPRRCGGLPAAVADHDQRQPHALGFYQKRGFRLVAVHPGAVDDVAQAQAGNPAGRQTTASRSVTKSSWSLRRWADGI